MHSNNLEDKGYREEKSIEEKVRRLVGEETEKEKKVKLK
jgi:hypothetical protein